jgi:hypothetical protein
MNIENLNFHKGRTIVTTVSMPLGLYAELISRAKSERVSLSELVRRALFKEFETRDQKALGEGY